MSGLRFGGYVTRAVFAVALVGLGAPIAGWAAERMVLAEEFTATW